MKRLKFIFLMLVFAIIPIPNAYAEDTIVNYDLWNRFIKYDLRITDYDSLSDEEKSRSKYY